MKIGVYGLGRFGAFWSTLLQNQKGLEVLAFNRNPDRPTPSGVQRVSLQDLMERSETVFLCCAISSMKEVLEEIRPWARPGQIIADTCSVKVFPAQWMEDLLPLGCQLLATHPMFGPDSARGGVVGLPLVLYPLRNGREAYEKWHPLFQDMGLSIQTLSPEEHDRAAAYSQGITHLVGRILESMKIQDHPIATRGYKSLLEIMRQTCNDPYQLFLDLQRYNPYTVDMRKDFSASLEQVFDSLASLDTKDQGV